MQVFDQKQMLKSENAYQQLIGRIRKRQEKEKQNPVPPYTTYPTDENYKDADGYAPLHYAAMLGDVEKVKACLTNTADVNLVFSDFNEILSAAKKLPLQMALENGHLEAAKLLYAAGADVSAIRLSSCTNTACRDWLKECISQELKTAYPQPKEIKKGPRQEGRFFKNSDNKDQLLKATLMRAIEIGDLAFIRGYAETTVNPSAHFTSISIDDEFSEMIKRDNAGTWFPENSTLLYTAVANRHQEMVTYLMKDGAKINPEKPYRTHPLMFAIKNNDEAMVDFLLTNGADIHYADRKKYTPLMYAVMSENIPLVKKLLKQGARIEDTSIDGDNVFHLAAYKNNEALWQVLSEQVDAPKHSEIKNIYGHTPQYIQKMIKENTMPPTINQMKIIRKMICCLISQYIDPSIMPEDGHCNGIDFLHLLRSRSTKSESSDYYFSTLALMAEWDGSDEKLFEPFGDIPQRKYYKNLAELFSQWIKDVAWFQQNKISIDTSLILPGTHQAQRTEQYLEYHTKMKEEKSSEDFKPHFLLFESGATNIMYQPLNFRRTRKQHTELFKYLNRMPSGLQMELIEDGHAVSDFLADFHNFHYSDPNHKYKVTPTDDPEKLTQYVTDYKYIRRKIMPDEGFCPMNVFYFQTDFEKIYFNTAVILTEEEIPKDKAAADLFQKNSPNGFSPLHIAAMTHNVKLLKRLIADGFYDPNNKDEAKRSPLVMAIISNCEPAANELLSLELDPKDLEYAAFLAYQRNQKTVVDKILQKSMALDLTMLFIAAIRRNDLELVKLLVNQRKIPVYLEQRTQPYPLTVAIMANAMDVVKYFLAQGADPFKVKPRSVNQRSAFETACSNFLYNEEIFELMCSKIKSMHDLDENGYAPIHYAIKNHNARALLLLLDQKADLNIKDRKNNTIFYHIHDAFLSKEPEKNKNYLETVKLILKSGFKIVLDTAEEKGKCIEFFKENKDKLLTLKDEENKTVFDYLYDQRNDELNKILEECGISPTVSAYSYGSNF